jgi:formylglycine-generating enzyme required for sulfatase activity
VKKLSAKVGGLTFALPTEAEWEYACRAGTSTPFHTGETISPDGANYNGNYTYGNGRKGEYRKKTIAVASFKPNAFGLYDMHGNVYEWCQDWYDEDYYKNSPKENPTGAGTGKFRVLRGGSWGNGPGGCRSARRVGNPPTARSYGLGCRVVVRDFR